MQEWGLIGIAADRLAFGTRCWHICSRVLVAQIANVRLMRLQVSHLPIPPCDVVDDVGVFAHAGEHPLA